MILQSSGGSDPSERGRCLTVGAEGSAHLRRFACACNFGMFVLTGADSCRVILVSRVLCSGATA